MSTHVARPPFDPASDGWTILTNGHLQGHIGPLWTRSLGARHGVALCVDERHLNRNGTMHGGLLVTLFDESLGFACDRATGGKAQLVTVQMNSMLIAQVRPGDFVVASSEVVKATRTLLFARGGCTVDDAPVMSGEAVVKMRPRAAG